MRRVHRNSKALIRCARDATVTSASSLLEPLSVSVTVSASVLTTVLMVILMLPPPGPYAALVLAPGVVPVPLAALMLASRIVPVPLAALVLAPLAALVLAPGVVPVPLAAPIAGLAEGSAGGATGGGLRVRGIGQLQVT